MAFIFEAAPEILSRFHGQMGTMARKLGSAPVGLLELNNYPRALCGTPSEGARVNLGAIDIARGRERRVPRFNDFRRCFALMPYSNFEELAGHLGADSREALERVYDGDIEKIDLIVGCLAEKKTDGFLFSQTVYALFIHQTERRLECDRFMTEDFNEGVYTKEGFAWVQGASLRSAFLRQCPDLIGDSIPSNAFLHWAQ